MAEHTRIEWADHTFNPWIGCTKVSPACDRCYAERFGRRFGVEWGNRPRRRTSEANWRKPMAWNRRAQREGRPAFVFCASLADVFDNQVPEEWRADLWDLIAATPHLIWLLLTKRPQNIRRFLPANWGHGWPHVWLGTTVENQAEADRRVPHLLAAPAARRFLSCEPLLGPVNLDDVPAEPRRAIDRDSPRLRRHISDDIENLPGQPTISWVICGGESGPKARPSHPDWFRSLRDQCATARVPFFFKQWGEWVPEAQSPEDAVFPGEGFDFFGTGDYWARLGKAHSGRLLDGCTHGERPPARVMDSERIGRPLKGEMNDK